MSVEPSSQPEIENLLAEARTFPPSAEFVAQANATADLYAEAEADFEAFWAKHARDRISWFTPFEQTLEWDLPFAKWFLGGELNVTYNCVDRHVERGLGDKVAYHWIGEPGDTRTLTYRDLQAEVNRAANALKELGVRKGDRVAIYMPMIPELPIAMLACAKLGAAHTVVFGGFSAEALGDRINDAQAKVLITADGGWRRGKKVGLKHHADEAVASTPVDRARPRGQPPARRLPHGRGARPLVGRARRPPERRVRSRPGRVGAAPLPALHLGHDRQAEGDHPHQRRLPAPDELHPRDRVRREARRRVLVRRRHRLGHRPQLHRLRPARQRHDRGHVRGRAGHARLGPLVADRRGLQGHDPVLRPDGHPGVHEAGRSRIPPEHDLSSLRLLGSVGEPINPEAWLWYHENIGRSGRPDRRHLVADRDRGDPDQPAARRDDDEARLGHVPAAGDRGRRRRRQGRERAARWRAATSSSSGPGRRCCAGSTATRSATGRPTGAGSPGCTSPATARSATTTATCGCSAGSTT